jgi:hypothetical protein
MRSYVPRVAVALLAFANGVACVALFDGAASHLFGVARELLVFASLFVSSGLCFSQAFSSEHGLRRRPSYNLMMLSLSGLLFFVGAFLLMIMLVG